MQLQPLRMRCDYGSGSDGVNPYLNTPPTKLKRMMETEEDTTRKRQMVEALDAWRMTQPGPFWKSGIDMNKVKIAHELIRVAKLLTGFIVPGSFVEQREIMQKVKEIRRLPLYARAALINDIGMMVMGKDPAGVAQTKDFKGWGTEDFEKLYKLMT